MKWILPLLLLCGCATLKPLPQQTLDCAKAEMTVSNGVKAATCIGQGGDAQTVETCFLGIAEGVGLDILQCEGQALWTDLHHAQSAAAAVGTSTAVLQTNAGAYLQAKGVPTVTHP